MDSKILDDEEIAGLFLTIAASDQLYIKPDYSGGSAYLADSVGVKSKRLEIFYSVQGKKCFVGFYPKHAKEAKINGNLITMNSENGNKYTLVCFVLTPASLLGEVK